MDNTPFHNFCLAESCHNYHSVVFSSLAVVHSCSAIVFEPRSLQPNLVHKLVRFSDTVYSIFLKYLKFVSAIFIKFLLFHKMIALEKL